MHRGPLNLSALTMRNPNIILENLCKILTKFRIEYKRTSFFNIKCSFGELKFVVEINSVEKFPNVFVVKFYKNNQSTSSYFDLCEKILELLQLK